MEVEVESCFESTVVTRECDIINDVEGGFLDWLKNSLALGTTGNNVLVIQMPSDVLPVPGDSEKVVSKICQVALLCSSEADHHQYCPDQKGNYQHEQDDAPDRKGDLDYKETDKQLDGLPESADNVDWSQPVDH